METITIIDAVFGTLMILFGGIGLVVHLYILSGENPTWKEGWPLALSTVVCLLSLLGGILFMMNLSLGV